MQRQLSAVALITLGLVLAAGTTGIVENGHMRAAGQAAQAAPSPPDGPRFIVTYLEVAPVAEAQALALLKAYRDATRRDEGNLKAEVLQRNARPGHFVVTEEWRDDAAWKNHRQAAHATQLQDKLKDFRMSPYDERSHTGLAMGHAATGSGGAVLVVTHVDVIPAGPECSCARC